MSNYSRWDGRYPNKFIPKCRYGSKCNRKDTCQFYHVKPRTVHPDSLKTKLCKYRNDCNNIEKCHFAHNKDDIRPVMCRFKNECTYKGSTCTRLHPDEEVPPNEELYERALKRQEKEDY